MSTVMNQEVNVGNAGEDAEISLLDLLHTIVENWRLLTFGPLLLGLLALGLSFFVPPTFTANTTFFPPQQQQSAAASMLQSLGALSGLAGAAAGIKNPADQYISLLKSMSVQGALVDRFGLKSKFEVDLKEDAITKLTSRVQISSGKDGLIEIWVSDHDPVFAATLANAYVDELRKLLSRLALTEAQQRRAFFEKQLLQTKSNLTHAELALRKTGVDVSALKSNPASAVNMVAQLQAQITAQQAKLSALRGYATDSSPEVKQMQAELAALRSEQEKISRTNSYAGADDSDYIARYREFKYYETLFELFSRQFELAKIDEARDGALIQVVDVAQPPERKSKPKKSLIAIVAFVGALFLLTIYVFARKAFLQKSLDPVSAEKMARLRRAWR